MPMKWLKYMCIAVLLVIIVVASNHWFLNESGFPYSKSSDETQITFDESISADQRSFYMIKSGEVDGKATLTSAADATVGQSVINSQIFGIKSTFENTTAPYPGFITQEIACETKKYVKEESVPFAGKESKMILAVVSGRRLFGICSLEEIKYASLYWTAYDEKRKHVVTIELFRPITDLSMIEESQKELQQIFNKVMNHS